MKRAGIAFLAGVLLLAAVLLARALPSANPPPVATPLPVVAVDPGATARLAQALRLPTVSQPRDPAPFVALHRLLESAFPEVHRALERQAFGDSLLYVWRGSEPNLAPILLLAHLDVVPAGDGWREPPFGGAVKDSYIWGRGALDDKAAALGSLEAVEALLRENFRPRRTVYLAFGADEEVGGMQGARVVAEALRARGILFDWALDEGSFVVEGMAPGIPGPAALVGVAEKGFVNLELSAQGEGGHASMPPPHTAVGRVAGATARLEANPRPARLTPVVREMFARLAPHMEFGKRLVFANLWLFEPLVKREMAKSPIGNAWLRTTGAATLLQGGVKENVLPPSARAVVNFRILPGETIREVEEYVKATVADPAVAVARFGDAASEPSSVSSVDSAGFRAIEQSIGEVFPGVPIAPAPVIAATDSRHFAPVVRDIYRFQPVRLKRDDVARIHGADERIGVDAYADLVRFYWRLIVNGAGR